MNTYQFIPVSRPPVIIDTNQSVVNIPTIQINTEINPINRPPVVIDTNQSVVNIDTIQINTGYIPINRPNTEEPVPLAPQVEVEPISIPPPPQIEHTTLISRTIAEEPFMLMTVPQPTSGIVGIAPLITYAGTTPLYCSDCGGDQNLEEVLANGNNAGPYEIDMNNNKIINLGNPVDPSDAVNKSYVDTELGNYLPLAGGTMTGNINMNGNNLEEVDTITGETDLNLTAPVNINMETLFGAVNIRGDTDLNIRLQAGPLHLVGSPVEYLNIDSDQNIKLSAVGVIDVSGSTIFRADADMSGNKIINLGNPVDPQDAVPLSYLTLSNVLAGGNSAGTYQIDMSGNKIINLGNPVDPSDAVNKSYVDTIAGAYLPLAGGTMSGAIDMSGNDISNIGSITAGGVSESATFGAALFPMLNHDVYATNVSVNSYNPLSAMNFVGVGGINFTAPDEDINLNGGDINLTQTQLASFMNLTATGGIVAAAGLGVDITGGGAVAINAGATIQILGVGAVSIGSSGLLGADTEVEKVGFLENEIYKAGLNDLEIRDVALVKNTDADLYITTDGTSAGLIRLTGAGIVAESQMTFAGDAYFQELVLDSTNNAGTAGQVLTALATGRVQWQNNPAGPTGATGATGATGPQGIQGPTGATGPMGSTGAGGALGYWGSFWSTVDQIAANTTTAYPITYNNTDPDSNGISIVSNSRITFSSSGVYNIQFSAQADRVSGSGTDTIDIWFRKNGTDIPDSNTIITVSGGAAAAKTVAAWNFMLSILTGDYVELVWRTSDVRLELVADPAGTSPTRPAIPSVIMTVQQVMYTQVGPTGATGPVGTQSLSQTLAIGNSAGIYNIDMSQNQVQNVAQITMRDDTDDQPDILFTKTGTQKATIGYNGSGINDKLSVVATNIILDGSSGNLETTNLGVSITAQGVPISLTRETTSPILPTTVLKLNTSGEVQIGDFSVGTTPKLTLYDTSGTTASISYTGTLTRFDAKTVYFYDNTGTYPVAIISETGDAVFGASAAGVGTGNIIINNTQNNQVAPPIGFYKNINGGATTSGTELGVLDFYGNFNKSAVIKVVQNGATVGANIPSDMIFRTTNATSGLGDRLRINNSGIEFVDSSGSQNFFVSDGGNTVRQNASTGSCSYNFHTSTIAQQAQINFPYGSIATPSGSFSIYRPASTNNLAFYNQVLLRNQVVMDTSGDTNFIGASGNTMASINASGQIAVGSLSAGVGVGRIDVYNTENNTNDCRIVMTKNKNGGNTSSGDNLGILSFNGWNSSTSRGAAISAIQVGANGAGGVPADMVFTTNNATTGLAERMRINTSGAVLIGTTVQNLATSGTLPRKLTIKSTGSDTGVITFYPSTGDTPYTGIGFDEVNDGMSIRNNYASSNLNQLPVFWKRNVNAGGAYSATNACMWILRDTTTLRSINAAGTLNANGADFAEYLEKDVVEEHISKGDIVGIKSNGKLTKKWSEAKSFLIKTTNPSFVGGDTWGGEMAPPRPSTFTDELAVDATPEQKAEWEAKKAESDANKIKWEADMIEYQAKQEAERVKYDRMAYSGQVPINVVAVAGDYIVAVAGADDSITGIAVKEDDITFSQYKKAVGRVIKILEDGRALVNVIVH